MPSKLDVERRHVVSTEEMTRLASQMLQKLGYDDDIAEVVARHLVEANLKGVESHGVMRLMGYQLKAEHSENLSSLKSISTMTKSIKF